MQEGPAPDPQAVEPATIPAPNPVEAPAGAPVPALERLRAGLATRLAARGLGPAPLAALALGPALVGGIAFAIAHHGLGAVLGLLAVTAVWIATTPARDADASAGAVGGVQPFAALVAHACVALLVGGVVLDAAGDGAPGRAAIAVWALSALLLLPLLRAQVPARRLTTGPLLWSYGERMTALLLAPLLGHPSFGTLVVAAVASADLGLRLALVRPVPRGEAALPAGLAGLFGTDGRPQPGVRLASRLGLAVLVLLYVLWGRSDGWRF